MRENPGKMRTRITPNTDSFYAVRLWNWVVLIFGAILTLHKKRSFGKNSFFVQFKYPVKHLRWSFFTQIAAESYILDVWHSSEYVLAFIYPPVHEMKKLAFECLLFRSRCFLQLSHFFGILRISGIANLQH